MHAVIRTILLPAIGLLSSIAPAEMTGRITDRQGNPHAGTVVYDISEKKLEVLNNQTSLTEHLTRAICDRNGYFTLPLPSGRPLLAARDLEDNFALLDCEKTSTGPLDFIFEKQAILTGKIMNGPFPKSNTEITVVHQAYPKNFSYIFKTKTNKYGEFRIENLPPGHYQLLAIEDIPAIGCMNSVVTKQKSITLLPGAAQYTQLGGQDLPFLTGKVTSTEDKPLHGVWVKLEPEQSVENSETAVWAAVTESNGQYSIYDIPPGQYHVQCVRRLARNTPTRVLRENTTIWIQETAVTLPYPIRSQNTKQNFLDIQIDMSLFMPLSIGQTAPDIESETLDGKKWSMKKHRGKIIVVYFYTSSCNACRSNFPGFENAYLSLKPDVAIVGISIDPSLSDCQNFVEEFSVTHPQIYAGSASDVTEQYKLSDVPTSFIIDKEGKIAQIDLFGATLEKFIRENLINK